jgi:hypothetical protein
MPFERPTEHYDERITVIDEQICALIKQRKEISNNNPGFPPLEYITNWAEKYELYEELLWSIFGELKNEEMFKPMVEPQEFQRHIPILKSVEKDGYLFSVVFVRQFANASVVNFNIDWDATNDTADDRLHHHAFWELFINEEYDCRMTGGGGSEGHITYNFIVSPPLPDSIAGIDMLFKEYHTPFKDKPTGLEVEVQLD